MFSLACGCLRLMMTQFDPKKSEEQQYNLDAFFRLRKVF